MDYEVTFQKKQNHHFAFIWVYYTPPYTKHTLCTALWLMMFKYTINQHNQLVFQQ